MITIIITSFKEPDTIGPAIEAITEQNIKEEYELIVSAPDKETQEVVKKYKKVKLFKDPGKGKSFALNLLFKQAKGEILILTDGDVKLGPNSINPIIDAFKDKQVGCISGRIISSNNKNTILGYWSHLLADAGAHEIRKQRSLNNQFLECSGYLFAFRNNVIEQIPLDVAEDSHIPYQFYKKGYKIKYIENSTVYVKNPTHLKDYIKQRRRTVKAHSKLHYYEKDFPHMKSLKNEILHGTFKALKYPKTTKEFLWTLALFPTRLYIWSLAKYDDHIKNKMYTDAWERVESTK